MNSPNKIWQSALTNQSFLNPSFTSKLKASHISSMTTNTCLLLIIGVSPAPPVQPIATVQPPRASGDCKIIMILYYYCLL